MMKNTIDTTLQFPLSSNSFQSEKTLKFFNHGRVKCVSQEKKSKLEECYFKGFKCKYCGRKMRVEYGYHDSFVFEHNISKFNGGLSKSRNIDIICGSCNTFKNSLNGSDFEKIIFAIRETWGELYFLKILKGFDNHVDKILESKYLSGKVGGRQKKKIDLKRVEVLSDEGKTQTEIAAMLDVSYSTLRNRCREANIHL